MEIEEEYRSCALELAKSLHWVIDLTSPSHVVAGWAQDDHSQVEGDFGKLWKTWYDKSRIKFNRKKEIDDIYRWATKKIEDAYDRNLELKQLYETGGSIRTGKGQEIGQAVVQDVAQNIADYMAYIDRIIGFDKVSAKLP